MEILHEDIHLPFKEIFYLTIFAIRFSFCKKKKKMKMSSGNLFLLLTLKIKQIVRLYFMFGATVPV